MTAISAQFATCPTTHEWRSALGGHTSPARWSELEAHLAVCCRCESTIDEITEQSDTFVRELCRTSVNPADEEAFRALHARLLSAPGRVGDSSQPPAMQLELPYRLGNYELLVSLGQGANGSVYRARHVPLDRTVAVKLLRPDQDMDAVTIDRFVQEVRAIGRLDHPHVVRATDAGEMNGLHFLVMEYVPGVDVSTALLKCGVLSVSDACEIVRQAARGLAYLHELGFAHRDVKPSNLLLTAAGATKLLDLGLVQPVHSTATAALQVTPPHGTPDYMSPEQWQGRLPIDIRSDLYSLGCTLAKLLTGTPPYRPLPPGFTSKRDAHAAARVPDLRQQRTDIPDAVQQVFERLLAKHPADRFQTAHQLAGELAPWASGAHLQRVAELAGLPATPPSEGPVRRPPRSIRWTRRQLIAATAVAGLGSVWGWSLLRRSRSANSLATYLGTHQWRDLAPADPAALLQRTAVGPSSWEQDDRQVVTIRSLRPFLLNLGQPVVGTFCLAVDMVLPLGHRSGGIFFQYFQRHIEDRWEHRFQSIELMSAGSSPAEGDQLVWSGWEITEGADAEVTATRKLWADTEVPHARRDLMHRLEIRLGRSGFPDVYWQGQHLPADRWRLRFAGQRQVAIAPDRWHTHFLGQVGLITSDGIAPSGPKDERSRGTRFRRPRLLYMDQRDHSSG